MRHIDNIDTRRCRPDNFTRQVLSDQGRIARSTIALGSQQYLGASLVDLARHVPNCLSTITPFRSTLGESALVVIRSFCLRSSATCASGIDTSFLPAISAGKCYRTTPFPGSTSTSPATCSASPKTTRRDLARRAVPTDGAQAVPGARACFEQSAGRRECLFYGLRR